MKLKASNPQNNMQESTEKKISGPSVRFRTRYDGEVSEPLVGRQGSRVPMRGARGSASQLPSHGRGIWPRDISPGEKGVKAFQIASRPFG